MGPLHLISNRVGEFVNKVVQRSEYTEKNSEDTKLIESSAVMESANSFETAESSASTTRKESAVSEMPSAVQETAQSLVSGDSIEMVTSSAVDDSMTLNSAGAPDSVNPVEVTDTSDCVENSVDNQINIPQFCVGMVSNRSCQTGENSLETAESSASTTRKESADSEMPSAVQETAQCLASGDSTEMVTPTAVDDSITLNTAGAPDNVNPVEVTDTSDCLKNSVSDQNIPQFCVRMVSNRSCQTGDQSSQSEVVNLESFGVIVKYAEVVTGAHSYHRNKCAEAAVQTTEMDEELDEELGSVQTAGICKEKSPANSEDLIASKAVLREADDSFVTADSSVTSAPPECAKIIQSPSSSESWISVQSAPTMVHAEKTNHIESTVDESSKQVVEESCGGKTYTELTPITGVDLSSTSFTSENNNLPLDDDNGIFDALKDFYATNALAITFDGSCNDQLSVTEYGDVSSTNTFVNGGVEHHPATDLETGQKFTCSMPDLTALLRECCLEEEFPAEEPPKEQSDEPKTKSFEGSHYPAVVATSPDSTGDGLVLRVLPCEIIVPRMENKFPQYAHLVRQAIKRKRELSKDSALKKKFRADIHHKIPLSSCKPNKGPEGDGRSKNSSPSEFQQLKSKKRKRSREIDLRTSVNNKSKPPKLVSKFVSPPKADLANYRIPKLPKLRIAAEDIIDKKKENSPKEPEASKRKISDASDDRGTSLRPNNPKVAPRRRDRGITDMNSAKNRTERKSFTERPFRVSPRRRDSCAVNGKSSCNYQPLIDSTDSSSIGTRSKSSLSPESVSANVSEDLLLSDAVILPGMPELSPWEPMDFDSARNPPNNERADKVIHVHDFPKFVSQMVTFINSPERRDNLPDPMRIETSKSILRNQHRATPSSIRRVRFGEDHSFRLTDCVDELWYPVDCLPPELPILVAIYKRYLQLVNRAKLSSLKWVHRCHHPESRPIRSPVKEPKFDCGEFIDKFDEEHVQDLVQSRLHKAIVESEYKAETMNETEFFIDVFDTCEKDCWKIILKRKMDPQQAGNFKLGDIVSLKLFTKSKKLNGKWSETIIFGYTEEVDVKVKGDHQIQQICLFVHPIQHEVKRDQAKIQTVVNIGQHLKLLTASAVVPYSKVAELFSISSIKESKFDAVSAENIINEFTESEQSLAVNLCYKGIFSEGPFLYFVDGAPGTGKTNFIVKLVEKLCSREELDYFFKVLIVTQSHASGDDILRRLVKSQSQSGTNFNILRYGDVKTIHPLLKKYVIDDSNYVLQKQNLDFDVNLEKRLYEAEKNGQKAREALGTNEPAEASALKKRYVEEVVIGSANVVIMSQDACYENDFLKNFTPCASKSGVFDKFSVCIFDDANEMSEIDMLTPVMTMASNLILIGDSRNPNKHNVSLTPFSQLLEKYKRMYPQNTIQLKTQFRVPPKILDCLEKIKLYVNSTQELNTESKLALKQLMVVDLPSEDDSLDHSENFEAQAKLCKRIIQYIMKIKEFENLRIGVMVATKKQKDAVKNELKSCSPETLVDKFAAFCGLEKDMIIACMPALLFPEKFLYTAMTRAKRSVIICGDFSRYKGQETIQELLNNAKRRKCFQLWDKDPSEYPVKTLRLFLSKNSEVTSS